MYNFMGLNSTAVAIQPNVSCTCNCKRSLFQSMEISKYQSCRSRGGCGRCPGCGSARRPRRGRGSSRGGSRRRPGPLAAMRFPGVLFLSPPCEPRSLSLICCRWDVGAGVTRRGPGCRSCPGSAAPRRHRAEIPAPPHRGSITARVSPFPRRPCPAPCPPAGVMLGRSRASPGGLRYPRVNPARLGTGGLRGPGTRVGFVFGNLFPPSPAPRGFFFRRAIWVFSLIFFNPRRVAVRAVPDLNIHHFSVCSFPLGNELHGGGRAGILLLRGEE